MKLDKVGSDVRDMYTKYPFPAIGNYQNFFVTKVLPTINELRELEPINRILDAGCGTGALTCDIAESLTGVEVVGADFSLESLKLAKQRGKDRGLPNVRFVETNLMEYDPQLGTFDFVYSQGVLHHLTNPLLGMCNVNRYLRDKGHAFIWLYALLGRRWILDCREAMQIMTKGRATEEEQLKLVRELQSAAKPRTIKVFDTLAKSFELLARNGFSGSGRRLRDHLKNRSSKKDKHRQDVHLMDMFLHPQDKFYRFREAVGELEKAGLEFVDVLDGMSTSFPNALEDRRFSNRIDKYEVIELMEKPSGIGYLVRKAGAPVYGGTNL